jgi:DNA repair exonuclease SbcCD nuclease subunit
MQGFIALYIMKILFTADVHIKLGQKNVPIQWALNRYKMLWQQLATLQPHCDLLVVGGDVFDKLPNMQELETYFEFVGTCVIPTIIYSGNHEMMKKDTTFLTNLKTVTNRLNPLVRIVDACETICDGQVDIIPYNCLKTVDFNQFSGKVLMTHVRGEIPPHVKPEVPIERFKQWDVVLAGDLHSYENCQANILYPGSPATTSFHRNLVDTGCIEFDVTTQTHVWHKFNLPQLIRETVLAGEPTPGTDYHHTIYEIEGDLLELSQVADSELVDKRVVKRSSDTALILNTEMTLVEEVREYLSYILELPVKTIDKVLQEFNAYENKLRD